MLVAEAMAEVKRIGKLLPTRFDNIRRYSSKKKDSDDERDNQKDYVASQRNSAEDLIKRRTAIMLAIKESNLNTMIVYDSQEMSVAEAIIWKQSVYDLENKLYTSFDDSNGRSQVYEFASTVGMSTNRMDDDTKEKFNLVPELLFDKDEIDKKIEDLEKKKLMLDMLIDGSNHKTMIEF